MVAARYGGKLNGPFCMESSSANHDCSALKAVLLVTTPRVIDVSRTSSAMSFDCPYGFMGSGGVNSVTGSFSGLPYTAHVLEYTNCRTDIKRDDVRRVNRADTFTLSLT